MIKKLFLALTLVCAAAVWSFAATPAENLMQKTVKKLQSAGSVSAAFKVRNNSGNSSGRMTVSGSRFAVDTPQLRVWYDGKTQWAYSPESNEVNISSPTPTELIESNPMSVLTNMKASYKAKLIGSTPQADKIELTPTGKTDISRAVVTISKSTGMPTSMVITGSDKTVTSIDITSLSTGGKLSANCFRFNAADYPGVEEVDLR